MEFSIKLTGKDLDFILGALNELPAKFSMDIILKIRSQADEQKKNQVEQE